MNHKQIGLIIIGFLALSTVIGAYAGTIGVNNLFGFTNGYGFTWLNSTNIQATSVYFGDVNVTDKYELGANFDVVAEINSNYEWSGNSAWIVAGETITQGNFVYINATGYLWKADADSSVSVPVIGIALKTIAEGAKGPVLMEGWVFNSAWIWTPGDYIFLSTTAGGKTQTAPSGSGDQVQVCAIPLTEDLIYFDPDLTVLEIT